MQRGWPERVGGRGGPPMLRTELGAALAARDLADPGLFSLIEVLAPTLIDFAPPELAAEVVPRLLSGAELWCQGFSERHRLADALVAVETLEATLTAAREEPGPETAALAKAVAGRTSRTVSRHAQQVLAGIGFTTEHRFHRFLKRTMALEGLFGSADEIVLDVGRRLLATRHVPTLIEL
jgi:alkylation response protein AidB-like acyl-CoA dehydrogenase